MKEKKKYKGVWYNVYKKVLYPDLKDALVLYSIPEDKGGLSEEEKESPNLLIKLPISGITFSLDGVSKDELFDYMKKYGDIPVEIKEKVENLIDEICMGYIDSIDNGEFY